MTGMPTSGRKRPSVSGVAAVDRALSVLTSFRKGDSSLELAELSRRTGLVKTTVMRMAISLENAGLILRLEDGSYQLDAEILRLGSVYQQSFDLESHVMPVLRTLVREFDETAAFYVKRGNQRLCLYRVDSRHLMREHIRPGDHRPMDHSATATVLKTFSGSDAHNNVDLSKFPLFTRGVTDPHTAALATPVFRQGGVFVGSLTISGPITRLTPERAKTITQPLREAGLRLSRALGVDLSRAPAFKGKTAAAG
jgi:DNA-binding IclR family transcriptional regulator